MERTVVFLDAGFIDKVANHFGVRFDFAKLIAHAADGGRLVRAYYYYCTPYKSPIPTPDEEVRYSNHQRFIDHLRKLSRLELRPGRLAFRGHDGSSGAPIFEQKGVDVMLAVDLMRIASSHQVQKAVLLTSDGDFVPAIKAAKDLGLEVVLFYEAAHAHTDLLQSVDIARPVDGHFIEATKRAFGATAPLTMPPP